MLLLETLVCVGEGNCFLCLFFFFSSYWFAMYIFYCSVTYMKTQEWRRCGVRTQPPFPPRTDNFRSVGYRKGTLDTCHSEWQNWAFDFCTYWWIGSHLMNINTLYLISRRILLCCLTLLDTSDFILSLKSCARLVCGYLLCAAVVGWAVSCQVFHWQVYLIFLPGEAGYFAEKKLIME